MPAPTPPTPPPAAPHSPGVTPFDRNFWEGDASWMVLADVAKIVLLYLLLRFVLRRLVDRVLWPAVREGEKKVDPAQASRIKTLASLVNSSISYILTFVFGIMLLRALRLDPIPLLTTASVAGLAVGFGAQKLVKDMISGFFILLENQYGGKATEVINKAGQEIAQGQPDLDFAEPPSVQGLGAMDAAKLTLRVSCPVTAPAKLTQAQIALRGLAHQRLVEAEIGLA